VELAWSDRVSSLKDFLVSFFPCEVGFPNRHSLLCLLYVKHVELRCTGVDHPSDNAESPLLLLYEYSA
jgi:hypothetical protein